MGLAREPGVFPYSALPEGAMPGCQLEEEAKAWARAVAESGIKLE
jgi:hypothetical protein